MWAMRMPVMWMMYRMMNEMMWMTMSRWLMVRMFPVETAGHASDRNNQKNNQGK